MQAWAVDLLITATEVLPGATLLGEVMTPARDIPCLPVTYTPHTSARSRVFSTGP